jgi:hypothetical protein
MDVLNQAIITNDPEMLDVEKLNNIRTNAEKNSNMLNGLRKNLVLRGNITIKQFSTSTIKQFNSSTIKQFNDSTIQQFNITHQCTTTTK